MEDNDKCKHTNELLLCKKCTNTEKELSIEDMESFGFTTKKTIKDKYIQMTNKYFDYNLTFYINTEYSHNERSNIQINTLGKTLFSGFIRNRSELKTLLRQITCTNKR